ncbi:glycosyltransferase [Agromyces sp. ZXT2-3]|uniref:glycosyltransferase n=1 Tax=Agromyces sp. ZXT2-3 TaxID=3461152 RepID=UPI0040551E46
MPDIAIVTVDAGGNVPPALRLADELASRGHGVTVHGHRRQADRVAEAGHRFRPLESIGFWDSSGPRSMTRAAREAGRLAADPSLEREAADVLARDDLAVIDCLMPTAIRGARTAGVPTAALFHTYLSFWERAYRLGPAGTLARLRGVDPLDEWRRADLRLVVSDRELDPASTGSSPAASGDAAWVGAIETGTPARPDPGPPLIVVSLSTTWFPGQTDAYQRIATALGALPVRAVLTLGGLRPDRDLRTPSNVEIRDRADHGELFARASLLIGHGGHSTTFRALAHGVPVLVLPMHPLLDQPAVGRSIERAGVGGVLPRFARADRIAAATTRLLADADLRRRAQVLGERLRATDAATSAADAVERLVVARRSGSATT